MKTLIVYAHPDTGGHCSCICQEIHGFFGKNHLDYEFIDLYAIRFDPVLPAEEHYTRGHFKKSPQILSFQEKVKEADRLVFIYPVWWGTMPAIMKGFFDRVFTSHFAFKYDHGVPIGLLKGKKALVFLTSGATTLLSRVFQGGRPVKNVRNDILGFCGVSAKVVQIGNSNSFDDARQGMLSKIVRKELKSFYKTRQ